MSPFLLPVRSKNTSKSVKSIRFSNQLIEEVQAILRGTRCTFSDFVVAAVRYALDELEPPAQGSEKGPK